MQPTSQQSGQEYSGRVSSARGASANPEAPRVRTRAQRPEKYTVPPAPRRVVHVAAPDTKADSAPRRDRARRRLRLKRRLTMWEWCGFAASCVACIFLLRAIFVAEGDFRHLREQVYGKQTQLAALERQKSEEKNRLAHLKSEEGRDQLLAERGYLQPGTRILLFPSETPKR